MLNKGLNRLIFFASTLSWFSSWHNSLTCSPHTGSIVLSTPGQQKRVHFCSLCIRLLWVTKCPKAVSTVIVHVAKRSMALVWLKMWCRVEEIRLWIETKTLAMGTVYKMCWEAYKLVPSSNVSALAPQKQYLMHVYVKIHIEPDCIQLYLCNINCQSSWLIKLERMWTPRALDSVNNFFLPTSRKVFHFSYILPSWVTWVQIAHFAHFQVQDRKRGVLGWALGCFV